VSTNGSKQPNMPDTFWRGRRVLITGIGGFVGSHLATELLGRGAEVVGIVRDSRGERLLERLGVSPPPHLVRGSITDAALVERTFNEYEIEYCFHIAAQAIVGAAIRSPVSTFDSNIRGTWTMLEAARRSSMLRGLVLASSDKVYGDQPVLPYTEESRLAATYPYDASKLCAEVLAHCYGVSFGLPVAITRCANIYGGGDLNWSRLIPGTIRSVLRGEEPLIRSDGTLQRDYLYVSDAVGAYLALAENIDSEDVRGEAFNFGWGRGYTVLEIAETILRQSGSELRPRVLGQSKGEIEKQWLAADKALRVLNWQPQVNLETGIRLSVDWYGQYLGAEREVALTAT
jgi:CDP-glucose 4,6-dehydratase